MTPRRARLVLAAFAAYAALAVAYTWPLAIHLGGVPHDLGDPLMTTWFLWWSGSQAVPLTAHWWNAPTFFPSTGILAFSEHLVGLTPIAAPLTFVTGQPLVGHNVAYIATFVLSAMAAHLLAYVLTRRHDVSAIAAVAFAFAPYRLSQVAHLQVLASFWTPLCLAALHRYAQTWRTRWIAAASGAWVLQGLSCGYFALFLAVLAGMWLAWFAIGRWPWRRVITAAAAFAAGALVLAPFLLGYHAILRGTYGFSRSIGEIHFFSADVVALLSASRELLAWGWVRAIDRPETQLFPGLTLAVLAIYALLRARPSVPGSPQTHRTIVARRVLVALLVPLLVASALPLVFGPWQLTLGGVRVVSIARADKPLTFALVIALVLLATLPAVGSAFRRRSIVGFYALAAFVTWIFALGPDPTLLDHRLFYKAPYSWLMLAPGFDGLRVPARFWSMTLACLAVLAALAVHRMQGSARRTVVALAVAGLLVDGWPKRFVVLPAPTPRPSPDAAVARLDLPMTDANDMLALYRQMFDRKPLYNGASGFVPPHYPAMRTLFEQRDPRILRVLASRGPLGVVVDHASDTTGAQREMVRATPGSSLVRSEPEWSSYLIRSDGAAAVPEAPDASGLPIAIAAVSASSSKAPPRLAIDGDVTTSWNGGRQQPGMTFTIDLGQPSHVAQLVTDLGPAFKDFPLRLQIEISADGARWETVSSGSTALETYFAALRHPKEVPVVFPIGRGAVRFVRLTQLESGTPDWSIGEVRVLR